MIKCPYCKNDIDSDSYFCDQCGKAIMYCPDCKVPQKGTECNLCGEDLIKAQQFLSTISQLENTTNNVASCNALSESNMLPSQQNDIEPCMTKSLMFCGNGWNLVLKEGAFGRNGGIYPEFATNQYISGSHGKLRKYGTQWKILDLGSTNGTFINGCKIQPNHWYDINKGDNIKIATIVFTIQ